MKKYIILLFFLSYSFYVFSTDVIVTNETGLAQTAVKTLIINQNINLTSDITIDEDITLKFSNGGRITIFNGITLTLNGEIDAGLFQIFDCSQGGDIKGTPKVEYVLPQWWGASPVDNENDNDGIAIQYAVSFFDVVKIFPGTYNINSRILLDKNDRIIGTNKELCILKANDGFDDYIMSLDLYGSDKIGVDIINLKFKSNLCIRINDPYDIIDDGFSQAPILHNKISNCIFEAIDKKSNTIGILLTKVFDSEISSNNFKSFGNSIILNGCDINSINGNRISNIYKYGILEYSAGTFGSQNIISHNDILRYCGVENQGAFIKTTSRHIIIRDNYLENNISNAAFNKVNAYIDCTKINLSPLSSTSISNSYYIELKNNRIDGFVDYANYSYLIPEVFGSLILEEVPSIGESVPPSTFIDYNGNKLTYIKPYFNNIKYKWINIRNAYSFNMWETFSTRIIPENAANGIIYTPRNIPIVHSGSIDNVKISPNAFRIMQNSTVNFNLDPKNFEDINTYLSNAKVNIIMRCTGQGNISFKLRMKDESDIWVYSEKFSFLVTQPYDNYKFDISFPMSYKKPQLVIINEDKVIFIKSIHIDYK